ncbi:tRNA(Ile)-lysidine synthase [Aliarcobacter thereius]|uniref:tRNA(Ile)-lysidine synthase n=1 Tax=Aliarcobacter thereius TaxID=544718 RepID=A0A1C0B9L9_9BACT|nr:tRNA lysidine(34) synthetase TilS [Aliarcobacter thereius]OCL88595.1 tRNA(Ile)-lysidine synthase [Aliarcobacter thereius]OCL92089.1 tRNA(Ile)-lysidine synthase [Aliarcobacter thereius]OCM00262.1 tRNA(Ile)-lysidine synthase [Aliarcobacter thereius]TLS72468.1 tRNA lysidine(34) synthetase TilS [Aliarcobacter thereius]TLT07891.1 tRNA lysidine(34) synthetase TilS [Aliarcobacter thereius]
MIINFDKIKNSKNLLAFSAGVDSSALFFLLLNSNTPFDIAIVNYNLRDQSKEEIKYAKELAEKYNKKIYIKDIKFESNSNFEKNARDCRYEFFEKIINKEDYDILITAHQLNDLFEWFLMQFSKGAGLFELLGMQELDKRDKYTIFRPLLNISRNELEEYLLKNKIKYFIDSSNKDEKYRRNYFRNKFSNEFIDKFSNGVKNSFEFLKKDINSLNLKLSAKLSFKELEIFENLNDDNLNLKIIDKSLKKRGFIISQKQRDEILKQKEITISHKINITINENYIFIAPKENTTLDKGFKEFCRIRRIPKNIRAYIYINNIKKEDLVF